MMDVCVARQPILGHQRDLVAYELLYRNPNGGGPGGADGDRMTAQVLVNTFLTMGVEVVTAGAPAFINFTRDMLVGDYASLLPPEHVVIEILENVPADDEVVTACRRLKDAGYHLAMDDLERVEPEREALYDLAEYFKVDFFLASEQAKASIPSLLGHNGRRFVAEKIETEEVFEQALDWGYNLFQGYFFSKPQLIAGKDVPPYKLSYLRLLQQVQQPELDFGTLENIVKSDASLPYRLLRFINSPVFGWRRRIDSIKHALVAIGEREFRKWVSLLCLTGLGDDKPRVLLVQAVVRAHVCEHLAALAGLKERSTELFLMGLFSLFEAVVGRPLEELLADMPLSQDVVDALLHEKGPLYPVLEVAFEYEKGDWDGLDDALEAAGIKGTEIAKAYLDAIKTSEAVFETV